MDTVSRRRRSQIMASVRGKDTTPELAVRRALYAAGLRYRLHEARLPGKPDVVFQKAKVVVFVHGCFWHRHSCSRGTIPSTNRKFWAAKLDGNVVRDRRAVRSLRAGGWRIVTIWECKTRTPTGLTQCVGRVQRLLGKALLDRTASRRRDRRVASRRPGKDQR